MAPPSSPARASTQRILDLLLLALGATPLREMGLDAIRSVLAANPRIAVLAGAFDLEPVWELLESQDGFDSDVAKPPFALLKSLEGRLGVTVKLPKAMAQMTPPDIQRFAALSSVKREEVDKIVAHVTVEALETAPRPPPSLKTVAPIVPPMGPAKSPARRKAIIGISMGVAALSVVWLGIFMLSQSTSSPAWTTVSASEVAPLPVADAKRWREEVRATLTDANWLARPVEDRRQEMSRAFATLSRTGVAALVVVDRQNKIRASAQASKAGPVVKFY
jgi:hypothetical protein